MVVHRVIADDAEVVALSSRWDATVPPGRVIVTVEHAAPAPELVGTIAAKGLDL